MSGDRPMWVELGRSEAVSHSIPTNAFLRIRAAVEKMGQGASIAADNDEGGRALVGRSEAIAFDAGHADFHTVRDLPAGEGPTGTMRSGPARRRPPDPGLPVRVGPVVR